jgi:hypothetical protein
MEKNRSAAVPQVRVLNAHLGEDGPVRIQDGNMETVEVGQVTIPQDQWRRFVEQVSRLDLPPVTNPT